MSQSPTELLGMLKYAPCLPSNS